MEVDEPSLAVEGYDGVSSACDVEECWYRVVTTFPDPQYTLSRAMGHLWPALEPQISRELVTGFATPGKPTDQFDEAYLRMKNTKETAKFVEEIKTLMPAPFRRFDMTPVILPRDGPEVMTLAGLIAYYDLCLNPETAARHYAQKQLLEASGVTSTSHDRPAPHNKKSGASAVKAKNPKHKAVDQARNLRRRELGKLTRSLREAFDMQGPDRGKQVAEIKEKIGATREKWAEKLKDLRCPAREVLSISRELESLLKLTV
jgi:vacuolar-type H+-ATPase subunit H